MKKIILKYKFYILGVLILTTGLASVFYSSRGNDSFGFKCPGDFKTPEEYLDSIGQWVNKYTKEHPDAKVEEMMEVRDKLIEKYKCGKPPFTIDESVSNLQDEDDSEVDMARLNDAIRRVESEQPSRIGESPTEEEIYSNPFITHIRVALIGYLDGSNKGVEEGTLDNLGSNLNCGLNNFDKSYYKSKFIILHASDNEYGGAQADIVFVDKPDTIFWAWVYKLATEDGEGGYTLRGFCATGPKEDKKVEFADYIKGAIKGSKFSL